MMTTSKGRTGARARANIQPPPTKAEVDAAQREIAQIKARLSDLASGHPSVKTWKARLRTAEAIVARSPKT